MGAAPHGDGVGRAVTRTLIVLLGVVVLGVAAARGEESLGVVIAIVAAVLVLGALWIRWR